MQFLGEEETKDIGTNASKNIKLYNLTTNVMARNENIFNDE